MSVRVCVECTYVGLCVRNVFDVTGIPSVCRRPALHTGMVCLFVCLFVTQTAAGDHGNRKSNDLNVSRPPADRKGEKNGGNIRRPERAPRLVRAHPTHTVSPLAPLLVLSCLSLRTYLQ